MNVVEISGRLTRDPELRYIGQGERRFPVLSLNVAVDDAHSRYNRELQQRIVGSGFYKVEVPGAYGESMANRLTKGDEVYVKGSLSQYEVGQRSEGDNKQTKTQIRATIVVPMTGQMVDPTSGVDF